MTFHVILETDEDGWIVAECPALPGCVSQGRTRAEALENIQDAIRGILTVRRKHGLPMPEEIEVEVPA
jgi:antitoxin HicB